MTCGCSGTTCDTCRASGVSGFPTRLRWVSALSLQEQRFSVRLVRVRKLRDMTQEQLAAMCGLGRHVIAAIETGVRGIRLGEAVDLCAALDVDLAAMVSAEPMALRFETPID
jgi:DNA-binding XRE family transcriptional regulator